ncbi:MAG: class B sortase, partial [Ruminococcus sp.]|nr:class B sortase [Ruminococcus sp.]
KKKKKKKKPKTLGQKLRGLFPEKGDKPLEIVRKFVFLGSLVAIVVCGYMVGDYYLDLWRSRMEYSNIDDIYRTYTPIITSVEDDKPADDKYYDLLPGAKKLLDINPEVVGYMTIPTIDGDPIVALPVVQAEDNSKYLDINFKGESSRAGALFLDWRNSFDKVEDHRLVEKNSDNLIVYGHNMADESMFGALKYYRRYENYYESHPIIEFNSNYEQYTYKIFSFFLLDAEDDSDTEYDCWNTLNFDNEDEFYDFVNEAKRRTLRTNDVDVKYGDQILTISTCNTDVIGNDRGRLILMARRVRAGEDLYSGTKGSKANPNIKWPNVYYESRPNEKYDPAQFVPYGPSTTETKANIEE